MSTGDAPIPSVAGCEDTKLLFTYQNIGWKWAAIAGSFRSQSHLYRIQKVRRHIPLRLKGSPLFLIFGFSSVGTPYPLYFQIQPGHQQSNLLPLRVSVHIGEIRPLKTTCTQVIFPSIFSFLIGCPVWRSYFMIFTVRQQPSRSIRKKSHPPFPNWCTNRSNCRWSRSGHRSGRPRTRCPGWWLPHNVARRYAPDRSPPGRSCRKTLTGIPSPCWGNFCICLNNGCEMYLYLIPDL